MRERKNGKIFFFFFVLVKIYPWIRIRIRFECLTRIRIHFESWIRIQISEIKKWIQNPDLMSEYIRVFKSNLPGLVICRYFGY